MKCKCGKPAVIFRKYEGSALCRTHFIRSFEKKVRKTISDGGMISRGDRIAVALSGGKDSSAVLFLMKKLFGKRDDIEITALSIDEGIAGYRKDSLEIAGKLCKKLGIGHKILSFKREFGKSLDEKLKGLKGDSWEGGACTYCGVGRRFLLNKGARESKATKLCMGMNLDDEVQSIMMDYLKGDLARLSRMGGTLAKNGKFVPRIKPLREMPEKEVGLYAILNGLEVQEDECPHMEGPRFRVRDFLNEMEASGPGTKFSVLRTYQRMLPVLRETAKREKAKMGSCDLCGEPCAGSICKACSLWKG